MSTSKLLTREQYIAITYGLLCHGIFLMAGTIMFLSILTGFKHSIGPFSGLLAILINTILLIQFPLGHSFLLSHSGMKVLDKLSAKRYSKTLRTTVYATFASIQLIFLFCFWNHSGVSVWEIKYPFNIVILILNVLSWGLLSISSFQAGYQVQTGLLGWAALYKNEKPKFPDMPAKGMFSIVRQPIYLSFCLVLWTSPNMSLDLLIVAIFYSLYCFLGPLFKERRFSKIYGKKFTSYQEKVPYFIPFFRLYRKKS